MTQAHSVVLCERIDATLVLTLNRPDALNAWTAPMQTQYFDALAEAEIDSDVRVVVVTGAGRGFCAGADIRALQRIGSGEPKAKRQLDRPTSLPFTFRKPLIAAINGACAGIGLVQALYCDLRFATADAKLTTAYARRGLIAEHGMSWLLPRIVGYGNAMDLMLSGRVVLGPEAQQLGLVNRVCTPGTVLEEALAYAHELAVSSSPSSMAVIKQQARRHLTADLPTALEESRALMLSSYEWPDLLEGADSFRERRPPRFPPLGDAGFENDG